MIFSRTILLVGMIALSITTRADEGMWLPSLLTSVNIEEMQKMGSTLSAEDIYSINNSSIKDAIIALDYGSCTGELVSDEGLFLTNHHCGYGDIQELSTEENNYLRDGFWAMSKEEELLCNGKTVTFLIRIEDVSDQISGSLSDDMTEDVRRDSILTIQTRIENQAEDSTHYEARVKSMFGGNQFLLFVTETFEDIRLVGTPPHFIGKFGGDTDNWMWPRHTGDFSMFRIYCGPDGKPAEFSEYNIPLKPKHHLPISLKGYENGDFAMVMGYPGSTERYLTSEGVKHTMEFTNNIRIKVRKEKLDIIADYMTTSEKAKLQYASKKARSSNYYKYSIGQNRGLSQLKVVEQKKAIEDEFKQWVQQSDERISKYGEALTLINEAYAITADDEAYQYLSEALIRGPEIFYWAGRYRSVERSLDRDEEFLKEETSVDKLKKRAIDFYKDYDAKTDMKLVAALTKIYAHEVDEIYQPEFIKTIENRYKGDYTKWAENLFKKSIFDDQDQLLAFLDKPKARVLKKDPVLQTTIDIYNILSKIRTDGKFDKEKLDLGYRLYIGGLLEMHKNKQFYPDANSTMRLSYGQVGDYSPADAIHYNYFTTASGYIEKEMPGDMEFDVWPRFKTLYNNSDFGMYADNDGILRTCFITNNDITGGNSGSPVMNNKGELIGIAFDGNWEAMSGDIAFEPVLQKCINVDIRFVLWTIDVFGGASHLIDEMEIIR